VKFIESPAVQGAYKIYKKALRNKTLVPAACEVCGKTDNVHGHHQDYSKPLEVIWVCPKHHRLFHSAEKVRGGLGPKPTAKQIKSAKAGSLTKKLKMVRIYPSDRELMIKKYGSVQKAVDTWIKEYFELMLGEA
jgi:hypothetical protein